MLVLAGALALLALGSPALAKDGDVIVRGTCSATSTAKLKLSGENGRIEVELEVDQNRNGVPWKVVLTRGTRVARVVRLTRRRAARSPCAGWSPTLRSTSSAPSRRTRRDLHGTGDLDGLSRCWRRPPWPTSYIQARPAGGRPAVGYAMVISAALLARSAALSPRSCSSPGSRRSS